MAIIVTTPRNQMGVAAQEAKECVEAGGGSYFRRFGIKPRKLDPGSRIFYTEDGYVRGFAVVSEVVDSGGMRCDTTGRNWRPGIYAMMSASSWSWIKPIPYNGFQGWRYFDDSGVEIIGVWTDPRPEE